jgi:hypothetical protein
MVLEGKIKRIWTHAQVPLGAAPPRASAKRAIYINIYLAGRPNTLDLYHTNEY